MTEQNAVSRPVFILPAKDGWHVLVRVQPGAKTSGVSGLHGGRLRIRLTAPAVDNKANKALAAFVAEKLGLKTAGVALLSGAASREKTLFINIAEEPDWNLLLQ